MNKQIFWSVFLVLFLFPSISAKEPHENPRGSSVVLKGTNREYAGDTLVFRAYSNMISFSEEVLASCPVDTGGNFECSIELDQTRHVFTYLGVYNCYLYAEPGMIYSLNLPRKREKTIDDLINPSFAETSVHLNVKMVRPDGVDPDPFGELNFAIRAFNDAFYPYYYKFVINAYGKRVDRKEIEKAEAELRDTFDSIPGAFLASYIDYRFGLLDFYGSQTSNNAINKEYILDKPVLLFNPAYMELFNEVYKDFFIRFAEENPGVKMPVVLNREMDYGKVGRILTRESSLKNDTLRELVLLKGMYDGIFDGMNIPSSMVQLLDSLAHNTDIEIHRKAAKDIIKEETRIVAGYSPPDFTLFDSDSNLVSLSDFRGDYVYLNFCNSFGYYCVREFEYLRVLHERLKDRLKIVTILVDDSFGNMQDLVRSNNYPWSFLHFSRQPDLIEHYDIRTYPYYFLIGPEGNMLLSPAPSPVENFEPTFNRIYMNQ